MKKLLLIAFALRASLGFGQGVIVAPQTALKSINGVTMPIASATISVCAGGAAGIPCSPVLASSLFKDAALTIPLSNPFTADVNGNYQFAIAPGTYTVTVTASGFNGNSYQITVATPISLAGGLHDPGANGPITRNGLNTTRPSTSADIISLWSGSCSVLTVLRGDGSCGNGSPGSPANSVQFNCGAAFCGDANFQWNNVNHTMQVGPTTNQNYLTLQITPTIYSESTLTGTTGGTRGPFSIPYDFSTYLNPAGASAIEAFNLNALLAIQSGNAQNFTSELTGLHCEGDHNGSGTVAVLIGCAAEAYNLGTTGTVTHLSGMTSEIGTLSASAGAIGTGDAYEAILITGNNTTVTNLYGFHFATPNWGTGMTINGTIAALQIDDPTGGGTVPTAMGINIASAPLNNLGNGDTLHGAVGFNCPTISAPSSGPAWYCGVASGTNRIVGSANGNDFFLFYMGGGANTGRLNLGNLGGLTWSVGTANNLTSDTGISRDAAGVIDFGNGTQGDKTATLNATLYTGPLNSSNAQLGSATGSATTPTYAFLGTNGSSSGMYFQNGNSLAFSYVNTFVLGLFSSYAQIPDANGFAWTSAINANPDTAIWRTASGVLEVGNSNTANNNGFFQNKIINVTQLTATAALTAGQTVKIDSANGSAVVVGATTDTGGGVIVGIVQNSPGAAGTAFVITSGLTSLPILGTGTCAIGNFVIQDTTTNGRVKCTATYTAGTEIGVNLATQNSVGSAVTMMVQLR